MWVAVMKRIRPEMLKKEKIKFAIDRGGTFTDVYAKVPGRPGFTVVKLLSEDPGNYADAPREGIRRILESVTGRTVKDGEVDTADIGWIRMGTTVATNALLERKGARCALVITRGFRDVLKIGNQNRPDLFDLAIRKPDLLYETVVEVDERLRWIRPDEPPVLGNVVAGITNDQFEVLKQPDMTQLRSDLEKIHHSGIRSLAVVFMHAYACPDHERAVGALAKEIGFEQVSLSSDVMPKIKLVARGDTTTVDAYLNPHIRDYLESFVGGFAGRLSGTRLLFMQSDGGLAPADAFSGSRAILSGPAGGVVGYAQTTRAHEKKRPVIGFDMGGTSTDVSRFDGEYELVFETETAGVRIQAPQINIKTVAAGGGSRLFFEDRMFRVGPESAGAHPGPVCYRKGGHLSVTDANLVLGRILPQYFPKIFGKTEDQPLDLDGSRKAMAAIARQVNAHHRQSGLTEISPEQVALGFVRVANETMVRAIREISVMRGFDTQDHTLATFGGAGPQHACAIARSLGISKVFIHRFAGILSAFGMGLARMTVERQQPASMKWTPKAMTDINAVFGRLERSAIKELAGHGEAPETIDTRYFLNLRYQGTDTAIMVAQPADDDFGAAFARHYRREFGFDFEGRDIMVDDIRIQARTRAEVLSSHPVETATGEPMPLETVTCYFEEGALATAVHDLAQLGAGHEIKGPAIIIHDTTTIVVEPDCIARITDNGDVAISVTAKKNAAVTTAADPIQLSIFSNLFMSIAEQMGRMLQKTAISTNIKERLDFSCALFGPDGALVANAPHVPVHLGAMSEAVKAQIRLQEGNLRPGDVLVSNHPAAGGSHLPDITVMTPVFDGDTIIFWVAARGHHADIGGISPGSMPPDSRLLEEEGVCIQTFKLVVDGRFQEEEIRAMLAAPGALPQQPGRPKIFGARHVADNLSDLKAQVAANRKGIDLVTEMVKHYGLDVVTAYMGHVQDAAEDAVRMRLKKLSSANHMAKVDTVFAEDFMDDGSSVALSLTIDRKAGSAVFDFSGTGPAVPGNCNAPKAVAASAVLYCLRCLIEKELPLNQGCLKPIRIHIPEGSLLDPPSAAAVVGGNVLTSQRVVDVILKAFNVAAASQGCMNNFTFGNTDFGYYETIGGGAGAGPGWHGQSGVHTHMTNTRITDPEILERRYPVLLNRFSLRRKSGGEGKFRGGDGLVREITFLAPLTAAILSERRVYPPYGMAGGGPGKPGKNIFIKKDGTEVNMGGKNEMVAEPGDRIRIMTPGGGGFGTSPASTPDLP